MITKLLGIVLLLFSTSVLAVNERTYIPKQAYLHLPSVKEEVARNWSELPYKEYVPGLIELESCISLTHSRCWNPKSELRSAREQGSGLGQITRAYNPDGTLRFDALGDLKRLYGSELKDLNWENVTVQPKLQIRALVLLARDNYGKLYNITDNYERLAFSDAAYNGGIGGVQKERRFCGLRTDCDPNKWFNNVEKHCLKSKKILYANRSACDINRHHVDAVLRVRMQKYTQFN